MTVRSSLLLLSLFTLAGCSGFDRTELAQMPARGVPPPVVEKLEHRRPLLPAEVAALSRHGVPPERLVRYLHYTGVTYLLTPEDTQFLRRSGVPPSVIDALVEEGADFARDYGSRRRLAEPDGSYGPADGFGW